jgi:CheY-like chemotaxis protein
MRKILVIEDEKFIRDNLLELLEIENFEAVGAENGSVGVHLATQEQPNLILCDVMMPELDGFGVLKALRENPATHRIAFMFLTASADKLNLQKIREMGIPDRDVILKPFNIDQFLAALKARLNDLDVLDDPDNSGVKSAS